MESAERAAGSGAGVSYWIVVALHVLVFWSLSFFPSQDGPTHLENAAIASSLLHGSSQVIDQTYVLSPEPLPNLTTHWLLVALLQMASPEMAEKALLTLYCVLFAASVPFVLAGFSRQAAGLSALCLPFLGNYLLHQGFYNFCLGTALGLIALGLWLRRRGPATAAALAVLYLALYFTHIVALGLTVALTVIMALWLILMPRREEGKPGQESNEGGLVTLGLALIPVLPLALWFVVRSADGPQASYPASLLARVVLTLDVLVSYRSEEAALAALFALALGAALAVGVYALWLHRSTTPADGLLLAALVLGVAVFVVPNRMAGGSWMSHRLSLWAALVLALWVATRYWSEAGRRILWSTGLLLSLGLLGLRGTSYVVLGAEVAEVVALGADLHPEEVLLPIRLAPRGRGDEGEVLSVKTKPLLHAAGHLAARYGVVNLGNYQPRTGHFPVRRRREVEPLVDILLDIDGKPTSIEVDAAYRFVSSNQGVDVVLVTGLAPLSLLSPAGQSVLVGLRQGMRVMAVSSPREAAMLLGSWPSSDDGPPVMDSHSGKLR